MDEVPPDWLRAVYDEWDGGTSPPGRATWTQMFRTTGIPTDVTYRHTRGFRGGVAVRVQPFEHETDARSAVGT